MTDITTWVLILFAWGGPAAKDNSNSLESIPGFLSFKECNEAGNQSALIANSEQMRINFACIKQTRKVMGDWTEIVIPESATRIDNGILGSTKKVTK